MVETVEVLTELSSVVARAAGRLDHDDDDDEDHADDDDDEYHGDGDDGCDF